MTTRRAHTRISGIQTVEVPAGKRLKVETSPQGVEIFNGIVPPGKKWTAMILVDIVEEDA